MKKNPVLVLTGLAVAAVAVVAGLTKDKWLDGAPQIVSGLTVNQAPEEKVVADAQTAAPTGQPAEPESTVHPASVSSPP